MRVPVVLCCALQAGRQAGLVDSCDYVVALRSTPAVVQQPFPYKDGMGCLLNSIRQATCHPLVRACCSVLLLVGWAGRVDLGGLVCVSGTSLAVVFWLCVSVCVSLSAYSLFRVGCSTSRGCCGSNISTVCRVHCSSIPGFTPHLLLSPPPARQSCSSMFWS